MLFCNYQRIQKISQTFNTKHLLKFTKTCQCSEEVHLYLDTNLPLLIDR
eukprot:UN15292